VVRERRKGSFDTGIIMKKKKCSKCKKIRLLDQFNKAKSNKDGLQSECRQCTKQYAKDHKNRRKQYREDHREEIRERNKQYARDHREEKRDRAKQYREDHRDEIREKQKQCYKKNQNERRKKQKQYARDHREEKKQYARDHKNRRNQQRNKKYHNDIKYHLNCCMSSGLKKALKQKKQGRHWETLAGFTLNDLKNHLEKQFQGGMFWNNYGRWHIDHIFAKSWFLFKSYKDIDFKLCWSLNNLQPLWKYDNLSKNANIKPLLQPKTIKKLKIRFLKKLINQSQSKKVIKVAKQILDLKTSTHKFTN